MVPCSFDESNAVLGKPSDMTHEECDPLSIARAKTQSGDNVVISCWKLTKEEADTLARTGRIWLYVYGQTMPPVALTAEHPWG